MAGIWSASVAATVSSSIQVKQGVLPLLDAQETTFHRERCTTFCGRQGCDKRGSELKFVVVLEKAEHNRAAYGPDILGCIATGPTPEETIKRYEKAVKMHLQGLQEDGLPTPEPFARAVVVEL